MIYICASCCMSVFVTHIFFIFVQKDSSSKWKFIFMNITSITVCHALRSKSCGFNDSRVHWGKTEIPVFHDGDLYGCPKNS